MSTHAEIAQTPQLLLEHHLKQLRLPTILREYDKLARQCAAEKADFPTYLLRLTELELVDRDRRAIERRIRQAKFPVIKSLDSFDFLAIPALNKTLVVELARTEFLARQIEQLELQLEELQTERATEDQPFVDDEPEPEQPAAEQEKAPAKKRTRRFPEHLEQETLTYVPVDECCPQCGSTMSKLGEDISVMLEYVPASFRVVRHVRPKMSCNACDAIVQAPRRHGRLSAAMPVPDCWHM